MTELILGPIIGGLSYRRAFLWARADGPGVLHAWLGQRPDLRDGELAGTSLELKAEDGFAGVAPTQNLEYDTRYYYALTLSGAPPDPSLHPFPSFTTFPLPGAPEPFNFAFGSCFRPDDSEAGRIFRSIDERRRADDLRFLLMLGDQIYADAYKHNGLDDEIACTLDQYRRVYAYTFSRPPLRSLWENLPVFMTLDDHEVDDDWRWLDQERTLAYIPWWDRLIRLLQHRALAERRIPRQRVRDALQAYWEHQGMHAPPLEFPMNLTGAGQYSLTEEDRGSLAYTFTCGEAAFFVLDTRTMRIASRKHRSMLGDAQFRVLEHWLLSVRDVFPIKFLVSSCSLLYDMWLDIPRDRWSGFPRERNRLLHFLAANGIEGVYVLTGDLHSAHAVRIELYGPSGKAIPVWEFCSSPFEQKPNWLSSRTYTPVRSGPIRSQECCFRVNERNFGVVRVYYGGDNAPQVRFELYGEEGSLLESTGE